MDAARRRDDFSEWHDLVPANCSDCGCEHYVAKDDPSIVWEPGRAWDEGCTDRDCYCHSDPLIGVRR